MLGYVAKSFLCYIFAEPKAFMDKREKLNFIQNQYNYD